MYLTAMGWEVDWIHTAQSKGQGCIPVNEVINFQVS